MLVGMMIHSNHNPCHNHEFRPYTEGGVGAGGDDDGADELDDAAAMINGLTMDATELPGAGSSFASDTHSDVGANSIDESASTVLGFVIESCSILLLCWGCSQLLPVSMLSNSISSRLGGGVTHASSVALHNMDHCINCIGEGQ
jgi:hypothetical protein